MMCTEHYRTSAITITILCLLLIEGLVDIDIFSWNHLLCRYVELGCVAKIESGSVFGQITFRIATFSNVLSFGSHGKKSPRY